MMFVWGRMGLLWLAGLSIAGPGFARCLVMGDSIAQGAGAHAPQCMVLAARGITTQDWVRRFGVSVERDAHTLEVVLISLGSNDGQNANAANLFKARSLVAQAKTVIWIAPAPKYPARSQILGVAREFGDVVYERPVEQMQDDGVHFNQMGYKRMASVLTRY